MAGGADPRPLSEGHIGYLGEYYCKQVIEASRELLEQYRAKQCRIRFQSARGGVAASRFFILEVNMMKIWKHIKKWVVPAGVTVVVILLARFVFLFGYVPTESMDPTLQSGSYIVGIRVYNSPGPEDIIIFEYDGKLLVKRVAAVPGDIVDFDMLTYMSSMERSYREDRILAVPEECCFLLGDNAQNSYDSRYWEDPFVREEELVGKRI